ncbi:TPA: DUF494 family protein [Escherichia coli]
MFDVLMYLFETYIHTEALMVLFNIPGCENAYQQMEELLFEVNEGMLH